jgi:hypothetical protein
MAIWIGVVSHWVLGWIMHCPDMPLYPRGGPRLGAGLWNHVAQLLDLLGRRRRPIASLRPARRAPRQQRETHPCHATQ